MMPIEHQTYGIGTLNGRGMSGLVRRRIITPALTRMNAKRVPMLTISTIAPRGTSAATRAAKMPKPIVSLTGVPVRGLTSAHFSGTSPSRAIAKKIRVWPYRITSRTLVMATSAPNAVSAAAQGSPAPCSSASDSGASVSASCAAGSAPTAPTETRM